jgi:hypothetical protein
MDSASPTADRIVGSEHVRTQTVTTLAGKLFATLWTTVRLGTNAVDKPLKRR